MINGNEQLDNLPLAMAYVPMQKWKDIYEAEMGSDMQSQNEEPFEVETDVL